MRISDWSSDVCSSDLPRAVGQQQRPAATTVERKLAHAHAFGREHPAGLVVELDDVGGARCRRVDVEARQAGRNLGIGDREQVAILGQQLVVARSEEHTSELQSLMRISYAVFCLKQKNNYQT